MDKFKKDVALNRITDKNQALASRNCLNKHLAQQMIAIWQDVVGDPKLRFTSNTLLSKLSAVLEKHFDGSLLNWRQYCLTIASSKFLMGESKAWILKEGVYLIWAIKDDNIHKVKSKGISTGDRQLTLSLDQQALNLERVTLRKEIAELETQRINPQRLVQIERHQAVITQVNDLLAQTNDSVLADHQDQFEDAIEHNTIAEIKQLSESLQQAITTKRWRAECRKRQGRRDNPWWHFTNYLVEVLANQHFGKSETQMVEERQQQLEARLKQLKEKAASLNLRCLNACS